MIKVRFDPRAFDKLDFTEKQVRQVIVASNIDLWNGLVGENPVDVGFARGSWWVMNDGAPATHPNPPAKGASVPVPAAPAELLASAGKRTTFANSAPYIRKLAEGWSPQAPAGWIDRLANAYQDYVAAHVLKLRGRSP